MIDKKYSYNNLIQIPLTNEQSREVYLIDKGKTIRNELIALSLGAAAVIGFGYWMLGEAFRVH